MDLALAKGISPKRLSGWEPTEVITPTYDADGRLERLVIEREPEWDEEQIDLLLAARDLADGIGPHGIPWDEAMSPLADPNDRFNGWHYKARVRVDHAQRALNLEQKTRREAFPDEDAESLRWRLERVEDGPPTTDREA